MNEFHKKQTLSLYKLCGKKIYLKWTTALKAAIFKIFVDVDDI